MPDPAPAAPVVAITGAGGAIADVVAHAFHAEGWHLALLDRPRNVDRLRREHPRATVVAADLTDPDEARRAVHEVQDAAGGIDALINLAGGFSMQSAADAPLEALEAQLDVNLRTLYLVTGAALPQMIARERGHIVAIGAGPAKRGGARMPAYAAAKGAVASYLSSVRAEVAEHGVWASLLWPMGTVDTPANRESMPDTDPDTWIARESVAEALLFLVTRGPRGRVPELELHVG